MSTGALDQSVRDWVREGIIVQVAARGRSMLPWIPEGSMVRLSPREEILKPGRCYIYRDGLRLVCHRLVLVRGVWCKFMGDSGALVEDVHADAVVARARIAESAILCLLMTVLNRVTLCGMSVARTFALDMRFFIVKRLFIPVKKGVLIV